MAPPIYPDVQGQRVSHSSLELGLEGSKIRGVSDVSWKNNIEIQKIFGTSREPIGRTGGKNDPDAEITWYSEEYWRALLPIITKNGVVGYAELPWTLKLNYSEKLGVTVNVLFIGARFMGPDVSHSEGNEAIKIKTPLSLMGLVIDGKYRAFTTRK